MAAGPSTGEPLVSFQEVRGLDLHLPIGPWGTHGGEVEGARDCKDREKFPSSAKKLKALPSGMDIYHILRFY